MDVRLRRMWFAPDISGNTSGKYVSKLGRVVARGHRLRKGIHRDLPDEWRDKLPSDAVVLSDFEGKTAEDLLDAAFEEGEREHEVVTTGNTPELDDLSKNDLARHAAEHGARITEEAEADRKEQLKEQRLANLAKAREAKKEKKDNV